MLSSNTKFYSIFAGLPQFYRVLLGFHLISRSITEFYRVFPGIYQMLLCNTKFQPISLGFCQFYRVLPSFSWYLPDVIVQHQISTDFSGFYPILPSFTETQTRKRHSVALLSKKKKEKKKRKKKRKYEKKNGNGRRDNERNGARLFLRTQFLGPTPTPPSRRRFRLFWFTAAKWHAGRLTGFRLLFCSVSLFWLIPNRLPSFYRVSPARVFPLTAKQSHV